MHKNKPDEFTLELDHWCACSSTVFKLIKIGAVLAD